MAQKERNGSKSSKTLTHFPGVGPGGGGRGLRAGFTVLLPLPVLVGARLTHTARPAFLVVERTHWTQHYNDETEHNFEANSHQPRVFRIRPQLSAQIYTHTNENSFDQCQFPAGLHRP